jgi:glycosyltransferase involved in cell wall biosynthesis
MGARFPIRPWMAASDVIVAPAVAEPFGRGIVEPTLLGTPVIAADDGGNREIISDRETGLLVKPDDPSAFADAVMELLARPNFAKELSENALRQAQERFSEEEHVRVLLQIYREVASHDWQLARVTV